MAAVTITGRLTSATMRRITDPDYLGMRKYSPNTERYLCFLNCCLTADDGRRYFFDSPKVCESVGNGGSCAVVLYHVEGSAAAWFREVGGENGRVATAAKANGNSLEPLVKDGDVITIRASVKAMKPTYTALNRVKLVSRP